MSANKTLLIATALCAVLPMTQQAWAQQADSAADTTDAIIIHAQRRAQADIDVPVQVTALSAETLAANDVQSLKDIGDRIPNTYLGENSGYGTPAFSIRGVGGTLSTGGEEPVAIFFDEQFIPRTFPAQLIDLESVEVLRGPQATLYGRNATAGAMLLRSARPDLSAMEGYATAQFAEFGEQRYEAALSVPMSDTFAVRVAGLYTYRDGWATNTVNGQDLDYYEGGRVRASALWAPSDRLEIYANVEYGQSNFAVPRAQLAADFLADGNRRLVSEAQLDRYRDGNFAADSPVGNEGTDTRATLSVKYAFDGFDLTAAAGYYYSVFSGQTDSDASATHRLFNAGEFEFITYTQDLRLTSSGDGNFDWIVGLSAVEDRYQMPYFFIRNVPINRDTHFSGTIPAKAYAVYAEGAYHFNDQWTLTIGGRGTYEEKEAEVHVQGFNLTTGAPLAAASHFAGSDDWTAFKPRIILDYAPVDDIHFYGSVSTGFKSGGFNVFALAPAYNAEDIVAYEAGVKGRLFDRRMRFSAATFYYDYTDLQLRLGVPAGGVVIQNAADARIKGVEFESSFNLRNGWDISGSFSLLDTEVLEYVTRDLSGALIDAAGAELSRAPNYAFTLGAGYERSIGQDMYMRLSGTLSHRDEVYFLETDQNVDTFRGPSLTQVNLRATLGQQDRRWEVSAFVTNATDDVEVSQVELQGNFPVGTFNEPRKFGVEFSTRF